MNWKEQLESMGKAIHEEVPENMIYYDKSKVIDCWLGYEPATELEISSKEALLGTKLPNSYKDFLRTSNGFKQISYFSGQLLPVAEIDWISVREPEFVEIMNGFEPYEVTDEMYFVYGEEQRSEWLRHEYLINSIVISEWVDGSILMLNPNVWYGDECEAWVYANWYPGAQRYRSFEELMIEEYRCTLALLKEENGEI